MHTRLLADFLLPSRTAWQDTMKVGAGLSEGSLPNMN